MTTDLKGYCLTCGKGPLQHGPIHDCTPNPIITHLTARIAELEAREAERLKPCVWEYQSLKSRWRSGCGDIFTNLPGKFCDCGHLAKAKEEK